MCGWRSSSQIGCDSDERFELAAPVPLNLVCFRHKGGDAANQTIMDRLNQSGDLFLTHTKLNGKLTLALSVGQTHTQARHVEKAWKRIQAEAERLRGARRSGLVRGHRCVCATSGAVRRHHSSIGHVGCGICHPFANFRQRAAHGGFAHVESDRRARLKSS